MKEQIIVTIGREYGSGGHYIAQQIAEKLGVQLYDKELLEKIVQEHGYSKDDMEKYDEKPVNVLLSRKVRNYSNSIEEVMAEKVFDFIRNRAEEGESFVVVGRCCENVLRGNPNTISIFVLGDTKDKIERIEKLYNLSEIKAILAMKKNDKKRKLYHNYYSDIKWGDSRGYHVSINSSLLGIDKTSEMLLRLIEDFRNA